MKKLVFFILTSCLTLTVINIYGETTAAKDAAETNKVDIYCPIELESLSTAWISGFATENNNIDLSVISVEDPVNQLLSAEDAGIAIITQSNATKIEELPLKILIGRNALIPIVSKSNPYLEKLNQIGVIPDMMAELLGSSQNATWGTLLNSPDNQALEIFTTATAKETSTFKKLTQNNQKVSSIGLYEGQDVNVFMDKNPNALLFCRLSDIVDAENNSFIDGIQVLPFDRNANHQIDYMEMTFGNLADFSRALWIGKYPKLFSESLYLVSNEMPQQDSKNAFIEWVLTQGQEQLNNQGYTALTGSEIKYGLAMLNANEEIEATPLTAANRPVWMFILLAIGIVSILSIVVNLTLLRRKNSMVSVANELSDYTGKIDSTSINIPKGVWYDKTHTWLFREKNGEVRLGIDDFFQHLTGPLTKIELKNSGEKVSKGEALLTIARDGKRLTIYSPISGTITSSNINLLDNPSAINSNPYSQGWVYLVEPLNWMREMEFLKLAENYREWIKLEFARLKEFLNATLTPAHIENAVVLQDGGMIKDGLLAEMEPQVWEEFQTKFINTSK